MECNGRYLLPAQLENPQDPENSFVKMQFQPCFFAMRLLGPSYHTNTLYKYVWCAEMNWRPQLKIKDVVLLSAETWLLEPTY